MSRRRSRQGFAPAATPGLGWQWRTFPVFFAFVCGVFITGIAASFGGGPLSILFLASLAGMGFGLAHIFTRWLAVRRLQNLERGRRAPPRAEEPEETEAPPPPPRRRRRRRR